MYVLRGTVDRIPHFNGEHLWVATILYEIRNPVEFVNQENGPVLLDYDNMILGPLMGCYYCEQQFHPNMLKKPCGGTPEE